MSEIHKGPARNASKERYWRKHVLDQAASGLTARAYCEAHGLSEHSFYGWRRELSERDREAGTINPRSIERRPSSQGRVRTFRNAGSRLSGTHSARIARPPRHFRPPCKTESPSTSRLRALTACRGTAGSPSRTRTYNKPVNSRLLYH